MIFTQEAPLTRKWFSGRSCIRSNWNKLGVNFEFLVIGHGIPKGVSFPGKFDLKVNRSMKTPPQEWSENACSYLSAPDTDSFMTTKCSP